LGRLEGDAERQVLRALDVELDLFAGGRAHPQQEGLVGGEELPVEEVHEFPAIDGKELVTSRETELRAERLGGNGGDAQHRRLPDARTGTGPTRGGPRREGAGDGSRTHDVQLGKLAFYR